MVAPAIASAVAPVVVQSATSDEGLINKLFKIAVLVGFLLIAAFGFFILNFVISIADILGAGTDLLFGIFEVIVPAPIGIIFTAIGGLFSAFGFGGRK